jgi:integrase
MGVGKSSRFEYRRAVGLATPQMFATSARPASSSRLTSQPYGLKYVYDVYVFLRSDDLAGAFDAYLERIGRTRGTRRIYVKAVEELAATMPARPLTALSASDIDIHLNDWRRGFWTKHGRMPCSATYRNRVNALRAFFAWLERFDSLRDEHATPLPNPMRQVIAPRVEQKRIDWLRPAEDAALLGCPMTATERIVIWLLRWSGIRVGEAAGLLVGDVDLTAGFENIVIRKSKTEAGQRQIPITPLLQIEIERWCAHLNQCRSLSAIDPFLAGKSGRPLPTPYMWRLVKRVAFRAGVRPVPCTCGASTIRHRPGCPRSVSGENMSRITPHTLRRTFGSDLLNRGLRLEIVSRLLGHASTTVTEKAYAELLADTTRRELLAAVGTGDEHGLALGGRLGNAIVSIG